MKRGWAWLWMWVGVLSLLWILHPFRYLHHDRPVAEDRAVLGPRALVSAWCTAAPTASPPLARSRVGPRKSFAPHLEFWITNDVHLPWPDHRGPPGRRGAVNFWLVVRRLGRLAAQEVSRATFLPKFRDSGEQIHSRGFSTAFS